MLYPSVLQRKFSSCQIFYEELGKKVREALYRYCEQEGYAISSRLKTIESLAEKIETGRFRTWSEINDLFACTIIVPSLREEKNAVAFCKSAFSVTIVSKGSSKKSPEIFRFDFTRITAKLKPPDGLSFGSPSIYEIPFEIQIKSAFEHAWSVAMHSIAYKSQEIDWKRQRFAAQLKAIVEQLDMSILGYEQMLENMVENPYPELKTKKVIAERTRSLFEKEILPTELSPKDISRFSDNIYSFLQAGKIRFDEEDKQIHQIFDKIEAYMASHKETTPYSISLFQYIFAILIELNLVTSIRDSFSCHVTSELLSLYPKLGSVSAPRFNYEEL